MSFTIGSLFDGSGGFPLAAFMCEGTPVWASEVEPYPIAVTKTRFPYMKHIGSVTDIKGNEVEPVDVITFGSPCQDLSVAGKRAGLKHTDNGDDETTRSGLFMEAVRIIKEMREATGGKYPRFALWENVPGAFSSNKGEDFRVVCEELIKVVEPTAVMPAVPQRGWPYADYYCGDGWSLAYRVLDAQYWGVPQRRRRIYLVLDLRGERAREVLFERESLRGYFTEGRAPWQGVAADAQGSSGATSCEIAKLSNGAGGQVSACLYAAYGTKWNGNGGAYSGENFVIEQRNGGLLVPSTPGYADGLIGVSDSIGVGLDVYNLAVTGEVAASLTTATAQGASNTGPSVLVASFLPQKKTESMAFSTDDVSGTLHNGACPGFQNAVVLSDALPFDTTQVTSPMNYSNPKWGDPCHPLAAGAHPPAVVSKMILDDHGGSQISVREDGKSPTLRAETHGNLPCVMLYDARWNGEGQIVPTLTGDHQNRVTDYTAVVCEPIPIHDQATRSSGKRGDNQDGKGNGLGVGNPGDPMNTLTSGDRHAVVYSLETFHCVSEEEKTTTLKARDYKDPVCVAYGVDCRNYTETPEMYPTLQAKPNGGQSLNYSGAVRTQYIVRRLTPTECARLQGFPDGWAHPDKKSEFTDDEYRFWLTVRNTHAEINGKAAKEYTKNQMLTWYNKLHTDSAEYKLWGNGIALPTALYVMQGIAEVFK